MKKIIFTLVMAVVGCCLLCSCGIKGIVYPDSEKYKAGQTEIKDKVEKIELDWVSGSVKVAYHDEDTIKLEEKSDGDLSEDKQLHWMMDGTTLRIKLAASGKISSFTSEKDFIMTLP